MSSQEFRPVRPHVEIIRDVQSIILENHLDSNLLSGVAEEANVRRGAEVNLTILPPVCRPEQIEMGLARFDGFTRTEDQHWEGIFTLIPEEIPTAIPVDQFEVTEPHL